MELHTKEFFVNMSKNRKKASYRDYEEKSVNTDLL